MSNPARKRKVQKKKKKKCRFPALGVLFSDSSCFPHSSGRILVRVRQIWADFGPFFCFGESLCNFSFVREYCSVVILGCGVNALQNSRMARIGGILQEIDLENTNTGRKRPRLLENRRKSGQIDEKNARNLKKALPWHENVARVEFFKILGQNANNRPASPEN